MYGKEEIKEMRAAFWSAFDERMSLHRSASNSNKINWAHYRTTIPHLYFRIETNKRSVAICIDIQHKEDGIRHLFYEQFTELKAVMTPFFSQELEWEKDYHHPNGKTVSRISCTKLDCRYVDPIYQKEIINFLEHNLLGFDRFWCEYNEILFQLK
mgnify:CR=1 FL=1